MLATLPNTTIARFTLDQYHRMIETGILVNCRVELLNGLITEMTPEGPLHSEAITDIQELLTLRISQQAKIRTDRPITLPNGSEPIPDIALVKRQRYRDRHPGPEDIYLLIEFAKATLAQDREDKRLIYAHAGVPEYWVVNLVDQELLVYRDPQAGDYTNCQVLGSGEAIAPLAFAQVLIQVDQLLVQ
jgi:Uma2 family endonuclease